MVDIVGGAHEALDYLRLNMTSILVVFGAVMAVLHLGLKLALKTKWTWDEKVFRFLLDLVAGLKNILLGLVKGLGNGSFQADKDAGPAAAEKPKKAKAARKRTVRES